MGASGWDYVVPFKGSVAATFKQLRADVFATGAYYWPYEGQQSRPATEDELWSDEWVLESGTHSVLDVFEVGIGDPAGDHAHGKTFEVTDVECERMLGTTRPTTDDLAALGEHPSNALGPLLTNRGVGRHMTIFAAGAPDQILFFGYSGD